MKKTILLADDHPLIRVGMRTQLESMGFQRILEAWDQTSVQQTVAANADVALVLLDVVMPGHDGESWPVAFCEQHAHLPVLLVSGLPVNEVRVRFSGCKNVLGLISKARPFADLRRSIDCALDGIPQWPAPESCDQAAATSADRLSQLTPKQAAVARLVCMGLTNREVAHELHMQEGTVKNHLKDVFAKLGVTNRTQLALRLPLQM